MQIIETEVKFYLPDMKSIRKRIIDIGADYKGKAFETNIRFEDIDKSLIQKKYLLRLRKDTKARLTFKSKPAAQNIENDNQFKIFNELEVEVSDFATMNLILESIGFHKEQIYEKKRETFVLGHTGFYIDTMPYGDFLEIEGEKEDIKKLSEQIGLKWEKRILSTYLEIFDVIRKKSNLSFSDITFDNFENIKIDFAKKYLHFFEAGVS
ncbi:MAG: class IV adenylate cyclase [Deltaproteobacteria bacterium]|nr:class IV adenylate cyclase [Deltaproteobacteria bacterium]